MNSLKLEQRAYFVGQLPCLNQRARNFMEIDLGQNSLIRLTQVTPKKTKTQLYCICNTLVVVVFVLVVVAMHHRGVHRISSDSIRDIDRKPTRVHYLLRQFIKTNRES